MFGTKKILAGAVSGVVGGLVFGLMMAKMGTLPMIGRMIGSPTLAAGWVDRPSRLTAFHVHLAKLARPVHLASAAIIIGVAALAAIGT